MAKEPVVPEVTPVPVVETKPSTEPENIMNQKVTVASKKADAAVTDIINQFSGAVNNLEAAINKLLSPTTPTAPLIPEPPKAQKSYFKELDEKFTRWLES